MSEHIPPSICTASGVQFWPLDPNADDLRIEDIAHSLANQCRFAGHCREFYSVAQHSVMVSEWVPRRFAMVALLHDASEAYLTDVPRPIKLHEDLNAYRAAEERLQALIYEWAGFDHALLADAAPYVEEADRQLLAWEQRDIMPVCEWWERRELENCRQLVPMTPHLARGAFLQRHRTLARSIGEVGIS